MFTQLLTLCCILCRFAYNLYIVYELSSVHRICTSCFVFTLKYGFIIVQGPLNEHARYKRGMAGKDDASFSNLSNGLIFYANVVQANRSIFFPLGETNILTVFIAWLNLDLGIETCFYDGMDAYAFTWLQFLFPLYVWILIGLIIIASRYSKKIAQSLGNNPVPTLATLFLLSYSKILRNILAALSVTNLEYPNSEKLPVWIYDGSVPFFRRADHIVLDQVIFVILVFLLLFLPYTLLFLFGQCLQAYSHHG